MTSMEKHLWFSNIAHHNAILAHNHVYIHLLGNVSVDATVQVYITATADYRDPYRHQAKRKCCLVFSREPPSKADTKELTHTWFNR